MMTDQACSFCSFTPFCYESDESLLNSSFLNTAVKKQITLQKKELLTLPKNKFQHFYAVKKGTLKTFQSTKDGKESIHGFYFAGEVFGYDAIYTNQYTYSIAAVTNAIICEIPYQNLLKLIEKNPNLQERVLYLISQQLNMNSYLALHSAEQRLVDFLIDLSQRLKSNISLDQFVLPMTRQDIGNYLGLTTETISRLFTRLQETNQIRVENKKITILS